MLCRSMAKKKKRTITAVQTVVESQGKTTGTQSTNSEEAIQVDFKGRICSFLGGISR